ncbi:hypothetical protein GWK41_06225 [Persephonella atlantica]|uniref:V-type ATP synthase subunit I n=1 Tax=Persephonella atlantica TaxID=2699429 RepID=A0ABS1GI94_9AQUI|nr:V-type ATPase 116kDa subunit family protein [Persephonella atlantica]MBK3332659.1 hypothetical protein [Persephonella atlantica]
MIFPEKMVYLRIEIPEESFEKELINIGKSRLLHIDERKGQKLFLEEEKRAEYLYALTEKFLDILEIKEKTAGYKEFQMEEVEQFLSEIQSEINSISNLDKEIKKEEELLHQAEKIKMITSEKLNIPHLIKNLKHIKLKTGLFPSENIEPLILSLKSYDVFYLSGMMSEGTGWIVVFFVEEESRIKNILEKNQVKEIPLQYFTEEFVKELEKKKNILIKQKKNMKEKYTAKLLLINSFLKRKISLIKVKKSVEKHNHYYFLWGWVPEKKLREFVRFLEYSSVQTFPAKEDAPVLLKTPQIFKPFEKLIQNFSYPKYGEINPTVPFALSFLVLFGVMFGDVGHGFVLVIVGHFLKKRYKDAGNIFILSGISSTFFGFLYGSFFGFHDVIPHLLFSPIKNINSILIMSLVIGVIMLSISFLLNIISLFKRKKIKALIAGEGGLLWFLIYWYMIGIVIKAVVFNLDVVIDLFILGFLLLLAFVYIFIRTKSLTTSVIDTLRELLETVTNTVSFIRLGAFALAHSALFLAVFTVAKLLQNEEGETGILFWLVVIVGNAFIIVLEGIIVAIQTLRLEYYEFFKRFYEGGGTPYRPFTLD